MYISASPFKKSFHLLNHARGQEANVLDLCMIHDFSGEWAKMAKLMSNPDHKEEKM